jgi:hypothetical protein
VNKTIEGNIDIKSQSIVSKMVYGDLVNITCNRGVILESLYCKQSNITNLIDNNIKIDVMNGYCNVCMICYYCYIISWTLSHIPIPWMCMYVCMLVCMCMYLLLLYVKIHSTDGDIAVSNIDGSFIAQTKKGNIDLQINKLHTKSKSKALTNNGRITASIDPEVCTVCVGIYDTLWKD